MIGNKGGDLTKIFQELKSRQQGVQVNGAKALHLYMMKQRENSEELFFKLIELFKSSEKHEILGGLIAINKILKTIGEIQIVHFRRMN